jgi:3-oxoacyl-[acyl-carrier-protein] synthase II
MKRVVITGIGAVSPLGNSFPQSWDAIQQGNSGIDTITRFDAFLLPWKSAGEVKDFSAESFLSPKEIRRLDPFVHYAVAAALSAVADAGLATKAEGRRQRGKKSGEETEAKKKGNVDVTPFDSLFSAGIIIGSSRGGITTLERELGRVHHGLLRVSPSVMPSTTVSMAASSVAQRLGIKGHCLGISTACSSGADAIGEAFRLIQSGHSNLVLAGGSEAPLCRLCIEGYGSAGALSKKNTVRGDDTQGVPRPFDRRRDGFVLSEGACIMVIEDYEHAAQRGMSCYGEIIGYGNTTDAFHMTKPDPGGEARAMAGALKEAGISPDEVDYINTHGTATPIGDLAEVQAMRMVFGKRTPGIPATAIKSMTGHMLAASGALEVACTCMTVREGIIPPTINLREKDPRCDINMVTEKSVADIRVAISNSFGFGGVNAVIVLRKI